MLKTYRSERISFTEIHYDQLRNNLTDILWIDLFEPTAEEQSLIEDLFSIDIPTREEMHEIEVSNRLYQRGNTAFMTLTMVTHMDTLHPESHAVTFILHNKCLITVRYVDTSPFTTCQSKSSLNKVVFQQGSSILAWMLEEITENLADTLENIARKIEEISSNIFSTQNGTSSHKLNFRKVLSAIGTYENLLTKSQESLFNMIRVLSFISETSYFENSFEHKAINSMRSDLPPLIEHTTFLSNKINFLLDATLGMINIEQNSIIKIVSVAAVVFLPPTLVASIYGMNFEIIPELKWHFGYPIALLLMFLAGFLPYKYFKYKGWL